MLAHARHQGEPHRATRFAARTLSLGWCCSFADVPKSPEHRRALLASSAASAAAEVPAGAILTQLTVVEAGTAEEAANGSLQ